MSNNLSNSLSNKPNFSDQPNKSLWMLPIGGCGEFGNNMMLYRYQQKTILVDAGIMFPDDRKLGVNGILPNVDPIFSPIKGVDAYVITHGHEDHIGALPFLYKKWPAPIYATAWTIELIKKRFERSGVSCKDAITLVEPGSSIQIGEFDIEYLYVNHSIPDACSLSIKAGANSVFQTGDFKFEDTPFDGKSVDFRRFEQIGDEGIDVLFSDSTNATTDGFSRSEFEVADALEREFLKAENRIFISTFGSNLWRLMVIADTCKKLGKKLYIAGRGFERTLMIAQKLKKYQAPLNTLIDEKTMRRTPEKDLVVLVSGSQGEYRAMLPAIANGDHRLFKVQEGDLLILSSRVIPGNEKSVLNIQASFEKQGGTVISTKDHPDIHVSGHAHASELRRLISLIRPTYYVPVHGGFTQLSCNKALSDESESIALDEKVFFENGQIIELKDGICRMVQKIGIRKNYIDAESNFEMSHELLRERLRIGELGMGVWVGALSERRKWIGDPSIELVGLGFPAGFDRKTWQSNLIRSVSKEISRIECKKPAFQEKANEVCRLQLRRSLTKIFGKKPVVISKVLMVP